MRFLNNSRKEGDMSVVGFIVATVSGDGSYVANLDHRFEDAREENPWLVEFYAPWCGHCKKLEPVFEKVAASLDGTNIQVGKIDATKYSDMATTYGVRGFPTILFVKGKKIIEYHGDRTYDDIFRFAIRANSPAMYYLHSVGSLKDRQRKPGVFFLYVGDESHRLFTEYKEAAANYSISLDFYHASEKSMAEEVADQARMPVVLVYKDHKRYQFDPMLDQFPLWVSTERFTAVQSAAGSLYYDLMGIDKTLILVVAQESSPDSTIKKDSKSLMEAVHRVALDRNWRSFQFVHMDSGSVVNSIVLGAVTIPSLIAFNPSTSTFHIPEHAATELSEELISQFLADISSGKNQAQGGRGFVQQMKRALYGLVTSIIEIWFESRILFAIVVLVPIAVVGIVCYTLCCISWGEDEGEEETGDDDDEMDEEEETTPNQKGDNGGNASGHLKED